jgi:hypothetical protein
MNLPKNLTISEAMQHLLEQQNTEIKNQNNALVNQNNSLILNTEAIKVNTTAIGRLEAGWLKLILMLVGAIMILAIGKDAFSLMGK